MAPDEQAYMLMSLIPNKKAQPLMVEWQVASRSANGPFKLEEFDTFAVRAGLKARALPNPAKADIEAMQSGVPGAVQAMHSFMLQRQSAFASTMAQRLQQTLDDLEKLQNRQLAELNQRFIQLELPLQMKQPKHEKRTQEIHSVFDEYRNWVAETMTTEPQPYIQLVAAFSH